jgi:hypothetical protein
LKANCYRVALSMLLEAGCVRLEGPAYAVGGPRDRHAAHCTLHWALCVGVGASTRAWQERSAALEGAFDSRRRRCGTALGRAVGCVGSHSDRRAGATGLGGEQRTAHCRLGFR